MIMHVTQTIYVNQTHPKFILTEQCTYGDYKFKVKSKNPSFNGYCKDLIQNPMACLNHIEKCCLSCAGNGSINGGELK